MRSRPVPVPLVFAAAVVLAAAGDARAQDRIDFTSPQALVAYGLGRSQAHSIGDLDADGLADVAIGCWGVSSEPDFIRVFRAVSPRRFGVPVDVPIAPTDPSITRITDVDGDGALDVIAAGTARAVTLLGDGSGGFTPGPTTDLDPNGIPRTGLLDADGLADLVHAVGTPAGRVVIPFIADGSGAFVRGTPVPVGIEPVVAVEFGDLDSDSTEDVVIARRIDAASGRIEILRGDGAGNLSPAEPLALTREIDYLSLSDADADGDLDIIAAEGARNVFHLYENRTDDFLLRATLDTPAGVPIRPRAVDVDGNGIADVVAPTSTALFSFRGTGAFLYDLPEIRPLSSGTLDAWDLVDLDADGERDFYQPILDVGAMIAFGRPGASLGPTAPSTFPAGLLPRAIETADFDEDGRLDLAIANRGPVPGIGSVTILLGNGAGGFAPSGEFAIGTLPADVATGDYDGDGHADVAVGKAEGADANVLFGDGAGTLSPAAELRLKGPALSIATIDADENGIDDLVAKCTLGGSDDVEGIVLGLADGDRGFGTPRVILASWFDDTIRVVVGDLDLDGREDVSSTVRRENRLVLGTLYGDGIGGFQGPAYGGANSAFPVDVGDVDGDGFPDVVTKGGVVPGLGRFRYASLVSFRAGIPSGAGELSRGALTDFDSDGRLDYVALGLSIERHDPQVALVLRGNGTYALDAPVAFSTFDASSDLVVGDFDRDCHPDVAVAHESGAAVLFLDRSLDSIAPRAGNVNAAAGPIVDVAFVNGSAGAGAERRVTIDRTDPFELRIENPPSLALAAFAFYAWLGEPHGGTVQILPQGLGRIAMPTPLGRLCRPAPRQAWNNLGFVGSLGAPTLPSSPAPSIVVAAPGGLGGRAIVYLQGFIRDAAAPNGLAAVTNGILLDVR